MDKQVKVIIGRFNKNEIKKINNYLVNLKKIIGEDVSVTILDPRHNVDYNNLIDYYSKIAGKLPNVNIINFYLSQYLKSNTRDNVNKFTKNYIGNQKMTVKKGLDGQRLFMQNGEIRIAVITDKDGRVKAVDYTKPGQKLPHQRVSVNSSGNIQVIRHFDDDTHLPKFDEYVDTELNTQMTVRFDEHGLRSEYQLVAVDNPTVFSEIDLYEQWFEQNIQSDNYVINLNRHYDVLFENKYNMTRIFLM